MKALIFDSISSPILSPIRARAVGVTDNGLLAPELAAGIRPREEREVHRNSCRKLVVAPASPGAPEGAGHHDRPAAARPRHHRCAGRLCATPARGAATLTDGRSSGASRRGRRPPHGTRVRRSCRQCQRSRTALLRAPCGFPARRSVAGGVGLGTAVRAYQDLTRAKRALRLKSGFCPDVP
jgi:hypothetical protein